MLPIGVPPLDAYDIKLTSRKPTTLETAEPRKIVGQLLYKLHKHGERVSLDLLANGNKVSNTVLSYTTLTTIPLASVI